MKIDFIFEDNLSEIQIIFVSNYAHRYHPALLAAHQVQALRGGLGLATTVNVELG